MVGKDIISKVSKGAGQIAEELAGSSYWAKVAPGMKQLQKEAGERIATSSGKSTKIYEQNLLDRVSEKIAYMMSGIQGTPREGAEYEALLKELSEKIKSPEDIDAVLKNKIFEGKDMTAFSQKMKDILGKPISAPVSPENAYKNASILSKMTEIPKAYFTNPDKDIRNTRIATAVGGYAAASIGGRYLTGGTLTKDSYGRNDIAGVPFI